MAKQKIDPMNNWITTAEAGAMLGITASMVGKLCRQGVFESRKVNNRLLLVNKATLANYTPKRTKKGGTTIGR